MVAEITETIQEDLGKIYRQCEVERRVREQTGSRLTKMIQQIGTKLQKEIEVKLTEPRQNRDNEGEESVISGI